MNMADDYGVRIFFESGGRTTVEIRGGDAAEVELNATSLVELAESNDVIAQALADVGLNDAKPNKPKKTSKRRARDEEEEPEDDEEEEPEDDDEDDEEEEAPRKRRSGTRKSPAKKTGTRSRRS